MADMQGLKIRTGGNPVIDEAMQIVGASPTNVTFSELYSALQNGVVDGEEINVTSASMQKHYEVCNYMSEIGIYPWLSLGALLQDFFIDKHNICLYIKNLHLDNLNKTVCHENQI